MRVKRIIPLLSIFLLAFTSFFTNYSSVSANSSTSKEINTEQTLKKLRNNKISEENNFKTNEEVRVIVEVEGETPIEYATKRNTLYKNLDESKRDELQKAAKSKQNQVQQTLQSEVSLKVKESFTTVVNGFSGTVKFKDIEKIRNLPNVEGVYISTKYNNPIPQPEMEDSHQFIQSKQTWENAGYKGEGQVIAILDSGVDPSHKDFVVSEGTEVALSESDVNTIKSDEDLVGKYYTEKVPYGYNYIDKNNDILDKNPETGMHGMHVAGTTAANGEIKGVAPEAQVLGMKVFSNDPNFPSTWEDIYLKAMDDSIKLNADVINMSLGSTASFYDDESVANKAISRAVENGVIVSVSAGNSGHIGTGYANPLAQNPDIGVVGAPGLARDSVQVAASGNLTYLYETNINVGGVQAIGYGADDWSAYYDQSELPIVSLGGAVGKPSDYEGVNVEGKVVLVQRGELSFYDKSVNAKAAGAIGIIVYDNGTGSQFYKNQGGWGILPFMMIKNDPGVQIEAAIADAGGETTLDFSLEAANEGPEVGKLTGFSSWGTTPSLELKPEITAPGGQINSTLNNDKYGVKSGTSMSAPHVAGGSALVKQYLKEEHGLKDAEASKFAKTLLMNSAGVIYDKNGQPFSPRRQGSGMMKTYAAVNTPISIVEEDSNQPKVELFDFKKGKITSDSVKFNLVAENHSDEKVHYAIDTSVLTDTEINGVNQLVAGNTGADVTVTGDVYEGTVTEDVYNNAGDKVSVTDSVYLDAGESKTLEFNIDLSTAKMPNEDFEPSEEPLKMNSFIEGFVSFTNLSTGEDLSVPYSGFYGNWDEPAILDGVPELNEVSYYGLLFDMLGLPHAADTLGYGMMPNAQGQYAISPNNDGYNDGFNPVLSFLRNAEKVEYNVLDSDDNELRTIFKENYVRKSYYDQGLGSPYSYDPNRTWAGKANFMQVEDGLYTYEIKSKVDYDGARWQSKEIPVYVDTVKPEVTATFNDDNNKLSWEVTEDGSGLNGFDIYVDGESILEGMLAPNKNSYILDEDVQGTVRVVAVDQAYNVGFSQGVTFPGSEPFINLTSPEPLTAYGSQQIEVAGTIAEPSMLAELKINGMPVSYEDNGQGEYLFNKVVNFETDGTKEISIEATDINGNNISITRTIFVDTTKGKITLGEEPPKYVESDVGSHEMDITLTDNYRQMEFYINDNFEYRHDFDVPLVMDGHTKELTRSVELEEGMNQFLLRLVDLGGNVTTKLVEIYKLAEGEEPPEETATITNLSTDLTSNVSVNRPTTISATADMAIEWDVTIEDPNGVQVAHYTAEGTNFEEVYTPGDYAANGEYTVTAAGVDSMGQEVAAKTTTFTVYNYSASINDVKVLNGMGEEKYVFEQGERAKIQADIMNLESFSLSPMLIVQVIDSENRLVSSGYMDMSELYSDSENALGYQVDTGDLETGTYTVEAYVWTGWDMNVLAKPVKSGATFEIE